MLTLRPGDTYRCGFTVRNPSTFALQNADTTPTAVVRRMGTQDNAVTVTVTNIATGEYEASWTVPAGYAKGDKGTVIVTATVGGTTDADFLEGFAIDTKLVGDLQDAGVTATANATVAALAAGTEIPTSVQDTAPLVNAFKVAPNLPQGAGLIGTYLQFRAGSQAANVGVAFKVANYNSSTGLVSFNDSYPAVPGNNDPCVFIGRSE